MEGNNTHHVYQKGFNEGYLITGHLPELSQAIANTSSVSERLDGFREGRRQFVVEKLKIKIPSYLKENKTDYSLDELTKNDLEPER